MATLPSFSDARKAPHHRRAYGAHRPTTPEQRARYVAESIALRQVDGRAWTWGDYGLVGNSAQQALVLAALARLQ